MSFHDPLLYRDVMCRELFRVIFLRSESKSSTPVSFHARWAVPRIIPFPHSSALAIWKIFWFINVVNLREWQKKIKINNDNNIHESHTCSHILKIFLHKCALINLLTRLTNWLYIFSRLVSSNPVAEQILILQRTLVFHRPREWRANIRPMVNYLT